MKIYTKTGDRGKTSLFSGERVTKGDERIEALGQLDELGSQLGLLRALLPAEGLALQPELERIQGELFVVGNHVATTPGSRTASPRLVSDAEVQALEAAIDRLDGALAPLRSFILPGGHRAAAQAHVARAVCRRVERQLVRLAAAPALAEQLQQPAVYLNRLSDYLFMLARTLNQLTGTPEVPWQS